MRRTFLLASGCAIGALWAVSALAAMQSSAPDIVAQMGLKPGHWRTTIRFTDGKLVPAPGKTVPAEALTAIEKKIGTSEQTDDCIGSKHVAGSALVLPGIKIAADCPPSEVEADKRGLKLLVSCGALAEGFKADIRVKATHTAVAMTTEVETSTFSQNVGYGMEIKLAMSSVYVGAVPYALNARRLPPLKAFHRASRSGRRA